MQQVTGSIPVFRIFTVIRVVKPTGWDLMTEHGPCRPIFLQLQNSGTLADNPSEADKQNITDLGRSFNKTWTPELTKAIPDQSFLLTSTENTWPERSPSAM